MLTKMSQIVFIFLAVISTAITLPVSEDSQVKIIANRYEFGNRGPGTYYFSFVTSDGTQRREKGTFTPDGSYIVRGFYSFIDPEGKKHYVKYIADDTGYHPTNIDKPPMSTSGSFYSGIPPSAVATLLG